DSVTNNQLSATGTTGAMVDYVWGGGEETRVDSASGDTYTDLYVEFASGARIVCFAADAGRNWEMNSGISDTF
ncbi:MAG: hypothetical protein GY761_00050, partial [Hyphomicrobiales bacterium]|nr:hypothetical protein [Hyphomicrobiales bacterium]